MSWKTLTSDDVLTRLTGAELNAYRTAALAAGQSDPLPELLASVADLVRGYVAGCARNTLGPSGTIPARLESAALDIVRYRLTSRLPLKVSDARQKEYDDAITLLKAVAHCDFAVEDPNAANPEQSVSANSPRITPKWRRFDSRHEEGA